MDEVLTGLAIATAIATARVIWSRRGRVLGWIAKHRPSWQGWRRQRSCRRLDRQVKAAIEAAHASGRVLPVKRLERFPLEVVYSDGSSSYFFANHLEAYKAALARGDYPRDRTFHSRPPLTIREHLQSRQRSRG